VGDRWRFFFQDYRGSVKQMTNEQGQNIQTSAETYERSALLTVGPPGPAESGSLTENR